MTFSIVIPAFNGEAYIEKAILSALNQTRQADEIIIHDDNSSDSTRKICEKYSSSVKYILNKNGPSGFVRGWNKTISLAGCDFITILHQDDLLYPEFLEQAEKAIKENPGVRHLFSLCDYINSNDYIFISAEKSINAGRYPDRLKIYKGLDYVKAYQKTYNNVPHIHRCPGVVTHRSIFHEGCWYNPDAGHIADDDFFYRIGKFTPVIGIMRSLAAFRVHSGSETGRKSDVELAERLAKDYIFQVKQWQDSDFLDFNAKRYFEFWSSRYIFKCYYYAFKTGDLRLSKTAKRLEEQLYAMPLTEPINIEKIKIKIIQLLLHITTLRSND